VIPNLVHQLFADPALAQENASVAVLNGTTTSGAAADLESTLQNLGFHAVYAGNADSSAYSHTEVIVNTAIAGPAEYTARRLQRILDGTLLHQPLAGQQAHIVVILGSDLPAVSQ
jgi:hypothetical protein